MIQKKRIYLLLLSCLFLMTNISLAQQTKRKISVEELFSLVKENHPNLAVSKQDVYLAEQNLEIAKTSVLPTVNAGLQASYIGDGQILDKDLSKVKQVDMPHFGNTFSLDATQLIWKGGVVRNGIKVSSLQEQLSKLSYKSDEQNIKLLVLGYYLDLYKIINQKEVYKFNIDLAEKRLDNIKKFYSQGMITRNDLIRGELQISNLNLALQVAENNRQILNKQLTTALGLDEETQIVPDQEILNQNIKVADIDFYKANASKNPNVLMSQKAIDIYETSEKIAKSDRMPALSAFAGNKLARPITTSSPAIDMYSNSWSAGLSLNFNIDALYKAPRKIKLAQMQKHKAVLASQQVEQMVDVAIQAAYIKYNEALTQNNTLAKNKVLADENYRIMESKYNNQFAILLDLIDASNQKLDASLQFANSEISIIYAYYKLMKESGNL